MAKCVVSLGYRSMVIDTDKALVLAEIFQSAEMYEYKYQDGSSTHHVYPNTDNMAMDIKVLPDALYKMAKLAGKPEER